MSTVPSRLLSVKQLETLAQLGSEHTAAAGDVLFKIGDRTYPLIVILEGDVTLLDDAGDVVVCYGPSNFIGEMNLLSGQSVFLTAQALTDVRYIAVQRDDLRQLLFDDEGLSELLLSTFIERRELLQTRQGIGFEIIGPRDSPETRRLLEFTRHQRLPHRWMDPAENLEAAALLADLEPDQIPVVRLPDGASLHRPTNGELSRALGIGMELEQTEEVDLLVIGGGPAGLGAAVYGASEGLNTLVIDSTVMGGQAGSSRRIENYLGFPAGITGTELAGRAITQARKFGARTATPYRAESLHPGPDHHVVKLEGDIEVKARAVIIATGAEYRRLPIANLDEYEGLSVFYEAGPPEGQLCGAQRVAVVGGGNSAGQAAVWLARGGALVTLLHRRRSLTETMSDYLIGELDRYGVAVRNQSEIAALHGKDGKLESVMLKDGELLPMRFLFLFLGAAPCTDWIGDAIARDDNGFILTCKQAGVDGLLATTVPGIFAAGDVRAGSTKRCATAVGEGATAVQFVHERLAGATA